MDGFRTTDSTVKDKDARTKMLPIVKTFTVLLDERHFSQHTPCYGADLRSTWSTWRKPSENPQTKRPKSFFDQVSRSYTVTAPDLGQTRSIRASGDSAEQEYCPRPWREKSRPFARSTVG